MKVLVTSHLFDGAAITSEDGLVPSLWSVCSTVTVNGYLGTAVGASYEPCFLSSLRLVVDGSLHVLMASIEQLSAHLKSEDIEHHIQMMGELSEEKMKALPKDMLYKGIVSKGQLLVTPPGYVTLWASAGLENCAFIRNQFVPRGGRAEHLSLVASCMASTAGDDRQQQQSLLDLLGSIEQVDVPVAGGSQAGQAGQAGCA